MIFDRNFRVSGSRKRVPSELIKHLATAKDIVLTMMEYGTAANRIGFAAVILCVSKKA